MTDKSEQIGAIDTNAIYMDRWVEYAKRNYSIPELAVHAEQQRIRAEAAEQERDKLLAIVEGIYGAAINDVSRWEGGMTVGTPVFQDRVFTKHLVRDLKPFIFAEGSKPDAPE